MPDECNDAVDAGTLAQLVKTKGRAPRMRAASARITSRWAPTCGARSILLMTSRSERVMPGPPFLGSQRLLEEACFVQRAAADRDLDVHYTGHAQAGIDRLWRRAPVLVPCQPAFAADGAGLGMLPSVKTSPAAVRPKRRTELPI